MEATYKELLLFHLPFTVQLPLLAILPLSGYGEGGGQRSQGVKTPLWLGEERRGAGTDWPCQRAEEQGDLGLASSSAQEAENAARQAAATAAGCARSSSKALSKEKKTDCASYRNNPSSSPSG